MSLEKKRETKRNEKKEKLDESSFRRLDFEPLNTKKTETKPDEDDESKEELQEIEYIDESIIDELTQVERDVLDIAEDILKLKRYDSEFEIESKQEIQKFPIIEKLYAKCIAKLSFNKGYSKDEIFIAIRDLEEKNWIVTNERRTKLEILQNEKLMRIIEFIGENPGVHGRDDRIEEELGITRTPFLKHIMLLERFELIRSKKIGKSLHYFLADVPEDLDEFKVIFSDQMNPKIIEEFLRDEAVKISNMADMLDVYPGTVQYHIKKMKKLNIIRSSKNREGKRIHLVNIELLKKYNQLFKEPDFSKLLKGL